MINGYDCLECTHVAIILIRNGFNYAIKLCLSTDLPMLQHSSTSSNPDHRPIAAFQGI